MSPEITELTVIGDRGRQRIQLDPAAPLDVGDILAAAGPACTGISEAAVDDAIDSGRLQLLEGEHPLDIAQAASSIIASELTIRLNRPVSRPLRSADAPDAPWEDPVDPGTLVGPLSAPEPSRLPSSRSEDLSPPLVPPHDVDGVELPAHAGARPAAPTRLTPRLRDRSPQPDPQRGEPEVIPLPAKARRLQRVGLAYRALRDATPQSNGLPAPPAVTRAKHAWRRSEYLDTLRRGIAAPELTECVVIAFLSSKGGVGKTTTAKLVAMALAEARRDRCVLIDANPDRGTLGTSFARGHEIYVDSIRAIANETDITPSHLDSLLANGPHGLRVLPAPQDSSERRKLGEADYTTVIKFLRRHVGIVIIDLGTDMLEGPTVAALRAAEQLVVISNDDWIAGEQTAASFWDDVRTVTDAEYTIVANDITGSHGAAAERLHKQLTSAPGADSSPRSVTVVAHNTAGYTHLQNRSVEWADLPHQWQLAARELTYRLAQDWPRLGVARPISPSQS